MSSTQHPTDTNPLNDSAPEGDVETSTATETPLSLLEKVKLAKSRQHLNKPDPRSIFKGPRIGNGPRGTRRSMGKR